MPASTLLDSVLYRDQFATPGMRAVWSDESVAARRLDAARAKALAAAAQSPALEVVRRYLDASGRLFEISHSIHPADRYAVTSVLKRVASRGNGGGSAA